MTLTNDQIEEIKRRCEAATPGPWESDGESFKGAESFRQCVEIVSKNPDVIKREWGDVDDVQGAMLGVSGYTVVKDEALQMLSDMDFMAHARQDIPALLETVEELLETVEDLRSIATSLCQNINDRRIADEKCKKKIDKMLATKSGSLRGL